MRSKRHRSEVQTCKKCQLGVGVPAFLKPVPNHGSDLHQNSSMCFGPQEPKQIKSLLQMKDQHHLGTILTGNYGSISTFLEPDLVTADFPSCGLNEATIFGLSHNITTADIFLVLQTHIGIYSVGAARSKSRCSYQSKHKVCSVAF